jgi:hypothetical protein
MNVTSYVTEGKQRVKCPNIYPWLTVSATEPFTNALACVAVVAAAAAVL